MESLRLGLIADTHGRLHPEIPRIFEGVAAILHAGDVGGLAVLEALAAIAPVHAVRGNIDAPDPALPLARDLVFPPGRVTLVHSHLLDPSGRDPEAMARYFAARRPRVIVFGHSHRAGRWTFGGVDLINPGPAGRPRLRDIPSVAILRWEGATGAMDVAWVRLDWRKIPR